MQLPRSAPDSAARTPPRRRVRRLQLSFGRGSLFRNSVAGAVATATDFAVVSTLVSAALCSVPAATFVGCLAGAVTNFLINRFWAFQSIGAYGRQIRRYIGVSATSALLNTALVALLVTLAPVPYQVIWVVARALVFVGFNYPLHRYYVFTAGGAGRT